MYIRDPLQVGEEPSKHIQPILKKLGITTCIKCEKPATTIVGTKYGLCEEHYQEGLKEELPKFVHNPSFPL